MIPVVDPKAFFKSFQHIATVAGWLEDQWAALLIPCLVGLTQQAIDILPAGDVVDYRKV